MSGAVEGRLGKPVIGVIKLTSVENVPPWTCEFVGGLSTHGLSRRKGAASRSQRLALCLWMVIGTSSVMKPGPTPWSRQ